MARIAVTGDVGINAGEPAAVALRGREGPSAGPLFVRLPGVSTGLDLRLDFPEEAAFDLLTDQTSGGGVAIGDVDGDGLPDVYLTRYNLGNRLYRNLGDWRFEDVTETARVTGEGHWCGGVTFADIDNDGDLDLYVSCYDSPNLLYLNRGDGVFDERAKSFGLDYRGASVMMAFADYDRDGDLDGYLVTHRRKEGRRHLLPKSTNETLKRGILRIDSNPRRAVVTPEFEELFQLMDKGEGRLELIIAGGRDVLYRNDGEAGFRDVTEACGLHGTDIGLAASWWDYDDDGWLDLYVSNDYKGADKLFRNNRDGTFTEKAREALPHVPWFSMGSDSADLNNDGFLDFLASDMSGRDHFSRKMGMGDMGKNRWFLVRANPQQYMRNAVFLGTGTGRVLEAAYLTGLANTDWTWSPKFGDFDLDGRVDLFVSNGMSRDFMNSDLAATIKSRNDRQWRETPILKQANLAFRNLGDLAFESVGERWGVAEVAATYGVGLGDLDRDGDLDMVTSNFGDEVSVYRNQGKSGAGLLLRLEGRASNVWGIGSKVTVKDGETMQTRVLSLGQGFMSANEPILHFGFPTGGQVDRVTIEWPSGRIESYFDVPVDHLVVLREGEGDSLSDESLEARSWFVEDTSGPDWKHRERSFDDYQRQPLLPARQSQFGPGMALGDADGDGHEDLYFGGAAGQSGTLFLRREGAWLAVTDPFALDAQAEDMGCIFFDADGDADLDLFVVSGGVEYSPGDQRYADRLYLNQGQGKFRRAPDGVIPRASVSGSGVVAADFDRDGDLDLFVGGRSVPGQYPLASRNQLLRNDVGRFVDVTDAYAPGLAESGMVVGALWSDQNGDGWSDLLVTHQWGPIRFFRNRTGRLVEETQALGLSEATGWWQGIVGGDFDRDGDIDYAVTNMGLNTKYHGDRQHPSVIYYGDMDGSGASRIVEAKFEGEICFPERGKSCSTSAIPSLAGKFSSFKKFALADLTDIYSPRNLDRALKLEVNTLDSVWLRNDRDRLVLQPLPRLAQIAPGFGIVPGDFDLDGWTDLLTVQNDFSPQPETGRMDGGMSLLLRGGVPETFAPVWPHHSGISIVGDGKSALVWDSDGDRLPDLVVALNDGKVKVFRNQSDANDKAVVVRLAGPVGNSRGVGGRVALRFSDGSRQVQEVYAGSGYLSHGSTDLFFALPSPKSGFEVEVVWPDGTVSQDTEAAMVDGLLLLSAPR